jgi:glycerol kinase
VGLWPDPHALPAQTGRGRRFEPRMPAERREELYAGWKRAVERARGWAAA